MQKIKVAINRCYGGFSLSKKAVEYLAEHGHKEAIKHLIDLSKEKYWCDFNHIERDNPLLIQVIEKLGEEANGYCANLEIEEIKFDIKSFIHEHDGMESLEIPYYG